METGKQQAQELIDKMIVRRGALQKMINKGELIGGLKHRIGEIAVWEREIYNIFSGKVLHHPKPNRHA